MSKSSSHKADRDVMPQHTSMHVVSVLISETTDESDCRDKWLQATRWKR